MREKSSKILELEKVIARAHLLKQRKKIVDEDHKRDLSELSAKLSKLMKELGVEEYEFEADEKTSTAFAENHEVISCKKVTSRSVVYDAKAVLERAGKSTGKALVNKTYTVNDMDGLIKLLKSHGVSPKDFKRFINVEMSVNEARLEQLYETGAISMEDLDGCYSVKENKSYWRITSKSSKDKER